MSGIEIISPKNCEQDAVDVDGVESKEKSAKLPNGSELLQHEELAYSNFYTNGESFDNLQNRKVDDSAGEDEGIHFAFDFKLHPDGVKKMTSVGNMIQSNVLVLQHKCVMHTYAYSLKAIQADQNEGLLCEFNLFPISFSYGHPTKITKGGVTPTMSQKPPILNNATLKIGGVEEKIDLAVQLDGAYKSEVAITLQSLKNLTKNGTANLRVEATIDECYFDLSEYVELTPKIAPVAPNSERILKTILRGEKPPKSDWVITVGDGSPRDFHVHGPILGNSSYIIGAAIAKHMSIPNDVLTMVSHENRFILQKLKSEDMKVLLTFAYQKRHVLPNFDAMSRVGQMLGTFYREELNDFFESWQAQLVNKTMALDRKNGIATIAECVKALITVHSAPQGALLAAFNTALIVGADTWQIKEASGNVKKGKIEEKVKKIVGYNWPIVDQALELIRDFKEVICGVEKSRIIG